MNDYILFALLFSFITIVYIKTQYNVHDNGTVKYYLEARKGGWVIELTVISIKYIYI